LSRASSATNIKTQPTTKSYTNIDEKPLPVPEKKLPPKPKNNIKYLFDEDRLNESKNKQNDHE